MEAPKCKICGERHYGVCLHFSGGPGGDGDQWPEELVKARVRKPGEPLKMNALPAFDRVAYQREYMRKRRLAAKMSGIKP